MAQQVGEGLPLDRDAQFRGMGEVGLECLSRSVVLGKNTSFSGPFRARQSFTRRWKVRIWPSW